jgi:nucleotide-binding universal stress UspA family protein
MEPSLRPEARIVRPDIRGGPRVIVLGVDGSPASMHAACYAAGLAARHGAVLFVLHVRTVPAPAWTGSGLWSPVEEDTSEPVVLGRAVEMIRHLCDRVEPRIRVGDPAREIGEMADELHADVVVVGSSTSLRHRLFGSVSSRLLHRRHWPVVVVP